MFERSVKEGGTISATNLDSQLVNQELEGVHPAKTDYFKYSKQKYRI
jgi:hypothetical protein